MIYRKTKTSIKVPLKYRDHTEIYKLYTNRYIYTHIYALFSFGILGSAASIEY